MDRMKACSLAKYFSYFLGVPFIPEELKRLDEPLILHISDTPSEIYPYLYRMIEQLKPHYIIHTGDLVDNIKLEYLKGKKMNYIESARSFFEHLKKIGFFDFYMVPGNHDCPETIINLWEDVILLEEGATIELGSLRIGTAHYFEKLPPQADIYLYGHNLHIEAEYPKQQVYLNGIYNIHVISALTKKVFFIPYPMGTNSLRRIINGKIGI